MTGYEKAHIVSRFPNVFRGHLSNLKVIDLKVPTFNGTTVEVWKWISNLIYHFIRHVITYPCRDKNVLVKWIPGVMKQSVLDYWSLPLLCYIFLLILHS